MAMAKQIGDQNTSTRTKTEPARFHFTKPSFALSNDSNSCKYFYDTKVHGLGIGVSPKGQKTFVLYRRVKRRPERITIGRYPDLTVEQSRAKAEILNGEIAAGHNPARMRRDERGELTFAELFEVYMERHSRPRKKTSHEDELRYKKHIASRRHGVNISKMRLSEITQQDIKQIHRTFGANPPASANRLISLISSVFKIGIEEGLFSGVIPCRGIRKYKEVSRRRYLRAHELPRFFRALAVDKNELVCDFVQICLFTGARRHNVMSMRWDEISFDSAEWLIPMTKNGESQTVPLIDQALLILKERRAKSSSEIVFEGSGSTGHLIEPKKVWRRILIRATALGLFDHLNAKGIWTAVEEAGVMDGWEADPIKLFGELLTLADQHKVALKPLDMRDLRVHDLRRTMGSWQAETGASLLIIGHSLNHKSPQSTAVYAHLSTDPIRRSMQKAVAAMHEHLA
jgi:integrase